jgi:CBS-domain-containing membrane protein
MSEKLPTSIQEVFATIPVSDLVGDQEVIKLSELESLENVWKTLTRSKIHSAPVVKEDGTLVGLVDALDLMAFALQVMPSDESVGEKKRARLTMALEEVNRILDRSGRDPSAPVEIDNYLNYLVEVFASGIHRVPLTNKAEKASSPWHRFEWQPEESPLGPCLCFHNRLVGWRQKSRFLCRLTRQRILPRLLHP